MKFPIDECMGVSIHKWLLENNYDSVSITELSAGLDDEAVLAMALQQERILITCDKDFGEYISIMALFSFA